MRHNTHLLEISKSKAKLFPFFLIPILFVFTADATLSYLFPILVEKTLNSNTLLGIIMSLSSVAGFFCDLWYPYLFKERSWKFQLTLGIFLSTLFPLSLLLSHYFLPIILFVFASMIWGVYFDMIIFSEDNFMVDEENKENLTRDWSIIYLVTLFTWVIGPILGETLSALAPHTQFFSIISLQVLGFSVAMLLHVSKEKTPSLKGKASRTKNIRSSLYELFKNWRILSIHIFGFLLIMFVSKLIESAYWMFGGLYAEDIGIKEGLHWLILGSYTTALILGSVVLGWLNLKKNKETISLFALLGSGVLLFLTNFYTNNLFIFLVITFFSSLFISVVTPLRNSEFTEYLNKLGKLRSSAIGLSCAVGSLSYIVGPTTLGILADYVGYSKMFSSLGFLALVTALVIFISKKKQ